MFLRCHIVVPVSQTPLMVLRKPTFVASTICFNAYSCNQFNMFSDGDEARAFIAKQQSLEQANFLMLTLRSEMVRTSLLNALVTRDYGFINQALHEIIYFSQFSKPLVIPHHPQRRHNVASEVQLSHVLNHRRPAPRQRLVFPEFDHSHYQSRRAFDLNAGIAASEAQSYNRPSASRGLDFPAKASLPEGFCVTPEVEEGLSRGKFTDLSLEESDVKDITAFACIKIGSFYQIYKKEDLINHIKATGTQGRDLAEGQFKDMNTGAPANLRDIFTLSSDVLSKKYQKEEVAPTRKNSF